MKRERCKRCGLDVAAIHRTPEDCLAHLAPRYALAQRALESLHKRYRTLEERLERAKLQERLSRKAAAKSATVTGRLERLEKLMGVS
jgi:hypothetical protein